MLAGALPEQGAQAEASRQTKTKLKWYAQKGCELLAAEVLVTVS